MECSFNKAEQSCQNCSSCAIKSKKKKAKSVVTDAVDDGESIPEREGKAMPTNLPATCAQKEVQINK